jgi:hypothetical protein
MLTIKLLILTVIFSFSATVRSGAVAPAITNPLPKYITVEYNMQPKGFAIINSLYTSDKHFLSCSHIDPIRTIITSHSSNGNIEWETILGKDSIISITNIAESPGVGYDVFGYKTLGPNPLYPQTRYAVRLGLKGEILWEWHKYKPHSSRAQDIILKGQDCNYSIFMNSLNIRTFA